MTNFAERAQGLGERLIRELRTDEIDRASKKDLEPSVARAPHELFGEAALADARVSGEEDGGTAPRSRRVKRSPELPELACACDEDLARASLHPDQYRAARTRSGARA